MYLSIVLYKLHINQCFVIEELRIKRDKREDKHIKACALSCNPYVRLV